MKHNSRELTSSDDKKKFEQKFLGLLKNIKTDNNQRPYEILMAYSGGKDSTYTMYLLKVKYGLRVLALTFDNGFVSDRTVANIKAVTDQLGIDHMFFKPKWEILKRIFLAAAEREMYPGKTLERASTICTSCIGLVKSICLKTAIEQDIPMIGFGWSPGQAPMQASVIKTNPSFIRSTQEVVLKPLKEVVGNEIGAYFLQEKHYAAPEKFPYNVHPMAWERYNEDMILAEIRKFAWRAPDDTDANSTNCLLNAFANEVHIRKYGFHPYAWEIANMVREGVMTRDAGLRKIYQEQGKGLTEIAREKLGAT
ncbi:MAG: hypothetical protein HZB61_02075 [Nitrospirae bacterium]|nr:hypothetical protein [Nitrospirota bacterium]